MWYYVLSVLKSEKHPRCVSVTNSRKEENVYLRDYRDVQRAETVGSYNADKYCVCYLQKQSTLMNGVPACFVLSLWRPVQLRDQFLIL